MPYYRLLAIRFAPNARVNQMVIFMGSEHTVIGVAVQGKLDANGWVLAFVAVAHLTTNDC